MLKEAVRIISKNLNDPFLAFLVARIVESREPLETGYLLGAESRRILIEDILPLLNMSMCDGGSNAGREYCGIESTMLSVVCGMWLQDKSVIQRTLEASIAYGLFRPPSNSLTAAVRNSISVAAAIDWLMSSHYCSASQKAGIIYSFLSTYPREKMKWRFDIGLRLMNARIDRKIYSAFHQACMAALNKSKTAISVEESNKEFSSASDTSSKPSTIDKSEAAVSTGFNFARLQKPPASSYAANKSTVLTEPMVSGQMSYDPVASFSVPSERLGRADPQPYDPLAAFDVPPAPPRKKNDHPYDPLSAFDMPIERSVRRNPNA